MDVGDVADPNGYYAAINLKATDLLAGESISFALAGGKAGAYIANSQVSPRYAAAERTDLWRRYERRCGRSRSYSDAGGVCGSWQFRHGCSDPGVITD